MSDNLIDFPGGGTAGGGGRQTVALTHEEIEFVERMRRAEWARSFFRYISRRMEDVEEDQLSPPAALALVSGYAREAAKQRG